MAHKAVHPKGQQLSTVLPLSLSIVAALVMATTPATAGDLMDYYADGKTTSGDGTYYWTTDWGQCSLVPRPPNARNRQAIALNARQWRELGESAFCGMCLTVEGSGRGHGANPIQGTFNAYVMDHCSTCTGGNYGGYGDLDFSHSGMDGRWDIKWRAVPCDVSGPIEYVFAGSHRWYIKVQPRNLPVPPKEVYVNGGWAERSRDGFFIYHTGWWGVDLPFKLETVDARGERFEDWIHDIRNGVAVQGGQWPTPGATSMWGSSRAAVAPAVNASEEVAAMASP